MKKLIFTIHYSFESNSIPPTMRKVNIRTRRMTRRLRPLEEDTNEFRGAIIDEATDALRTNLLFLLGDDTRITIHHVSVDMLTQITVRG
jgi:hypothetical protein